MSSEKSSLKIVAHSLFSFITLIISLIILNVLLSHIHNNTYVKVVEFLNSLLGLFFILFLVGMINSLFWNFKFPLNLLAPLSGGVLAVFIVQLVYKIFGFTQTFFYFDLLGQILSYKIYGLVFFATLIIGYLIIFSEQNWTGESYSRGEVSKKELARKEIKEKKKTHEPDLSWEDVGHEFRKILNNIAKALNRLFGNKNKKKKAKIRGSLKRTYDGRK
ncbi:MAG: hypothetical protein ACP5NZ_02455 [Nanobdellota archaeon]